jgi:transcriptional regulator with XRE-family HTH domain
MRVEMTFGEWLKRRRQQLGLTQKELARRVSCSEGTIRKLEGDARRPSVQLARLIATHLEILPQQQAAFVAFARAEAYTADMTKALAMMGEDLLQPPPPPLPTAV